MSKWLKYALGGALVGLVLYHSVYFRKLSEVNAATMGGAAADSLRAESTTLPGR